MNGNFYASKENGFTFLYVLLSIEFLKQFKNEAINILQIPIHTANIHRSIEYKTGRGKQ